MQESPGLKPGWFMEIRWFVMKKQNILLYNRRSNIFHISEELKSAGSLQEIVCHFCVNWNNIFSIPVEIPLPKHDLKIISRVLHIDGPHIFNIWMLILSWPSAFSESTFYIIFRISSLEKIILDQNQNLSVLSKSSDGRLSPLLINYNGLFGKKWVK